MNNMSKLFFVTTIAIMMFGIILFGIWIKTNNREIQLRNIASAQQDICKIVFDETWKIINQKAQIKDSYREDFEKIFTNIMNERYENDRGGSLMSWISEHNPEFDSSLYKEIMVSIESQRHKFTEAQTRLRDIKLQHDDLRQQFPSNMFVGGRPALDITIITSSKTEDVFLQGKEDDITVFNNR